MNRTHHAIRAAFTRLVLVMKRRFDEVTVADIAGEAKVGRSTFYLHFKSKEDVLKSLMLGMLRELATTASTNFDRLKLQGLLTHFWDNRRLGNTVFAGSMGTQLRRIHAGLIEEVLRSDSGPSVSEAALRMRSVQLSAAQISVLHAWMTGEIGASVEEVAESLRGIAAPGHPDAGGSSNRTASLNDEASTATSRPC